MKKFAVAFTALALAFVVTEAHADQLVRSVQAELKEKGFYYGAVDGVTGPETTAAIRRFQIRNGLRVTGTLTEETISSLRGGGSLSAAPLTDHESDDSDLRAPPADFRDRDREFLGVDDDEEYVREERRRPRYGANDGAYLPAPAPLPPRGAVREYPGLLRDTPFEDAPLEVQEDVVREAQARLAQERFYRGAIDGLPGPRTERAILLFQNDYRLRRTGRLDMDTLDELGLLSRQRSRTRFEIRIGPRGWDGRVYRGIRVY